ncbi:hypothetical protein EBB54_28265 [Schaedlerella arabinosiphila]|jgi:hypothetical protein|uniref:Uncharacterized protein n=1 Tax=Schaedlerella arabinosiphila TaxID=2044587 RepID=A0A426DPV2_9FIRM|nr:hypothetical protein EBB54_28265 [Schaedlerella arabinosiphila]
MENFNEGEVWFWNCTGGKNGRKSHRLCEFYNQYLCVTGGYKTIPTGSRSQILQASGSFLCAQGSEKFS